jgi:glutaredoxin-like YruB-family protein
MMILGGLLLVAGVLLAFVAGIALLVAAFREGVLWGLGCLFVPLVPLAFLIVHWQDCKKWFGRYLLGLMLCFAGAVMVGIANPACLEKFNKAAPAKAEAEDALAAPLRDARADIAAAQAKLAALEPQVTQAYAQLSERRKTLDAKDQAAVRAFNVEAANYNKDKTELATQKTELARLQKQEALLLDQRRQMAERAQGEIVIYSTSWCPACKHAKQYFTSRNIPFRELDVEKSPEARAEFQRLGGQGVPLIMIKGEKVSGFDQQRIEQLL